MNENLFHFFWSKKCNSGGRMVINDEKLCTRDLIKF